ncbi:hypothetical protein SeLEV6574_g04452 [Synchytrium endobioticum]|uniref:Ubiquinone biosynthesis monooxygenase COQ6, mitochondrial n=1 Tax=Synchytrium endobioticum TaxID=286115 RepID=A0A507CZP2_9FUNG|nr:hypothetical protein SeLEV6574_g04452 [Synchytrium endobioticum]
MNRCVPAFVRTTARAAAYDGAWVRARARAHSTHPACGTDDVYDVVIVGGGLVGAALACALTRVASSTSSTSLLPRVALIDESTLPPLHHHAPFANRVYSVTPASAAFLQAIGAWSHLRPLRVCRYTAMHVWDAVAHGALHFESPHAAAKPIAYVIENLNLQHALSKCLNHTPHGSVHVFNPASVGSIMRQGGDHGWPQVTIKNGPTLTTRLLIGADGAKSSVRHFANIDSVSLDYNQRGIVATLQVDTSVSSGRIDNTSAWQRFLPVGPVALLPLDEKHCSLVWSLSADLAKRVSLLSDQDFITILNAALLNPYHDVEFLSLQIDNNGKPLVDFTQEAEWGRQRASRSRNAPTPPLVVGVQQGSRAAFPLKLSHAAKYIGDRVALVGDAAHTVHPLAGQGLNLGLSDVSTLAAVIQTGIESGQDIGSVILLEEYAKDAYARNAVMSAALHAIQRLFGTDMSVVSWLRSVGMNSLNAIVPLKDVFMKVAGS